MAKEFRKSNRQTDCISITISKYKNINRFTKLLFKIENGKLTEDNVKLNENWSALSCNTEEKPCC